MGIASFSATGLWDSFHGLMGWLTAGSAQQRTLRPSASYRSTPPHGMVFYHTPTNPHTAPARSACNAQASSANARPLRVRRVMDAPHATASAGRMLISGRMADVCAELDRLAALEVAQRGNAPLQ